MLHHDIQPPTFIAWVDDIAPRENDLEWEDKTDERLFWRGSNTGIHHNDGSRWRYAQRVHLVGWASELNGTARVLMPPESASSNSRDRRVGNGMEMKKALINPAMMDVAFSGQPLACDPDYCDYLATVFEWRKQLDGNGREVGNHKYLVDVGFLLCSYVLCGTC